MIIIFEGVNESMLKQFVKEDRIMDVVVDSLFINNIYRAVNANAVTLIDELTRDLKNFNDLFKPIYVLEKLSKTDGDSNVYTSIFRTLLSGYENKIEVDLSSDKTHTVLVNETLAAIKKLNK